MSNNVAAQPTDQQNSIVNPGGTSSVQTGVQPPSMDELRLLQGEVLARENRLKQAEIDAEKERARLQKVVYDVANPAPAMVLATGLIVLLAAYVIYCIFIKPNLTGLWYDDMGHEWELYQGAFSSYVDVQLEGKDGGQMKVTDSFVEYGNVYGTWNRANILILGIDTQTPLLLTRLI